MGIVLHTRYFSAAQIRRASVPFLLLILFTTALFAQSRSVSWHKVVAPVKSNLTRIAMNSRTDGYCVSTYLLRYSEGQWSLMTGLPWSSDLNAFRLNSPTSLYAATIEVTNESFLFRYDGSQWRKVRHPLANFITAIGLNNAGTGWLGGWGELAHFDGTRWKRYPPLPGVASVIEIVGTDDGNLRIYAGGAGVLHFSKGTWVTEISIDTLRAFSPLGQNSAMAVCNSVLWIWNGSQWHMHSSSSLLKNVTRIRSSSGGELTAVGSAGTIIRYWKGEWTTSVVPTQEDLNDVVLFPGGDGWAVGNNGTLLRLMSDAAPAKDIPAGFRMDHIFKSGRGLDDEYGVAIEDINNDGRDDIYTVNLYNQNLLFINQTVPGSGAVQFRDESEMRNAQGGEADTSVYSIRDIDLGVGVADIDNDGDKEIYLCSLVGHNSLLLNTGGGYFIDVSHHFGHSAFPPGRSNSVSFADVDNDGDLDMFVANEASSNRLFENNGNGYFTDVTAKSGLTTERGGVCSVFGDLDLDGKSDLVVSFWTDRCRMYKNISSPSAGIRFVDITDRAGIGGEAYERSNAVALGDIDNDGDQDLFIAKRKGTNKLFRNDGNGMFADISTAAIGADTLVSYGACFADFDNNGSLDLVVSSVGNNRFYRNDGSGMFSDQTYQFGLQHSGYNTGIATGDVDNDGDIDLYSATYINGESGLFVNNINDTNSITISIEGTISNSDAVGARIELYRGGRAGEQEAFLQCREIGSGSGYASHQSLKVHFGLPPGTDFDVVVHFPSSGISKTVRHNRPGSRLHIREQEGMERIMTRASKASARMVIDPDMRTEGMKFFVVLLIIAGSVMWGRKRSGWTRMQQMSFHAPVMGLFAVLSMLYYYDHSLLAAVLPISVVVMLLLVLHLYYERVVLKRIGIREKEQTRRQIASDLHDDIASTLSSATIYLNVLKNSFKRPTVKQNELLQKIDEAIGSASEGMTDIVWTIAPKHDTLGDLITRIRILVSETTSAHGIAAEFQFDDVEEQHAVSEMVRRNIYLIMKEGMNNIRKHANASLVIFSVRRSDRTLLFNLTDNGRGLEQNRVQPKEKAENILHGNGIGNMQNRAKEIGAAFDLRSGNGAGTELAVTIEMMQLHH